MEPVYYSVIGLLVGFTLDQLLGDPEKLPHPIVGFGHLISFGEKRLNKGKYLFAKGAIMTLILVTSIYLATKLFINITTNYNYIFNLLLTAIIAFYCLSARTLRHEVRQVFEALEQSTNAGRKQLSRIVGRDTATLEPQQIRSAALETLAENLSDGVIAPLFWFALLGAPGMLAYKMINTLDSMIGYKNDRYFYFGKFAARLDDVANYVPARITAFLMLLSANKLSKTDFVIKNGNRHSSPNSGYPEAALAAILNCRFGGPNSYFGKIVDKPFIGNNDRLLVLDDMQSAVKINRYCEVIMVQLISISMLLLS
ncbi:MAG: cobalamin biosynthesis protein CobD [Paludibacter sp.]|nr:cobalamin biosynthesis protein CobD [Paludibacter sp.]